MSAKNTNIAIWFFLLKHEKQRNQKANKRFFVMTPESEKAYRNLFIDLKLYDHQLFFTNFRMTPAKFEQLLSFVVPYLVKESKFYQSIGAKESLFMHISAGKFTCYREKVKIV